jgi:TonB family protein
MTPQMWLENLAAYSLQVAVLVAAGTALLFLFRLKSPAVLLVFWQALLAICLILPAVQPWQTRRVLSLSSPQAAEEIVLPQNSAQPFAASVPATGFKVGFARFATAQALWLLLLAGIVLRMLWLALGLVRLRLYLKRSRRPVCLPEAIREMQWKVGVSPEVFLSGHIDTPVTFGWRRPAVLFPETFTGMSEIMQRPIACHELLHVERRDWLFVVLEEILRSVLWFHPAVWWVLGRIHLSREQVVDREVLRILGDRGPYLQSLLHIASLRGRPAAVPAPLLLRERHLVQRVALMLKESTMTRSRLIFSLIVITSFLVWTGTIAAAWFPLSLPGIPEAPPPVAASSPAPGLVIYFPPKTSEPPAAVVRDRAGSTESKRQSQEPLRVGGNVMNAKLISKVDPIYPELAKRARVEQVVILEVLVDEGGNVSRVRVIQGHPLLDQAAVDAVKQWKYSTTLLNGQPVPVLATVTIPFTLSGVSFVTPNETPTPSPTGGVLGGAPPRAVSPLYPDPATAARIGGVMVSPLPSGQGRREPMRVGGNVQESKIIKRVEPVYPEVAKKARVEQIVMLEVNVDEEGYVSSVRVIRGHPLLDQAAIDAVKQWVYSPTLLNGEKIPVLATVTVVFSLSQKFVLDADGYIKDAKGATISVSELRDIDGPIQITPAAQAPFEMIQQTMSYLVTQGVRDARLSSSSYLFSGGRLYYLVAGAAAVVPGGYIQPPVLDIAMDQLAATAEAALRSKLQPPAGSGMATTVTFTVLVDETGRILEVQGSTGPFDLQETIAALRQARVKSPGLRGNIPVPTAVRIMIPVTLK